MVTRKVSSNRVSCKIANFRLYCKFIVVWVKCNSTYINCNFDQIYAYSENKTQLRLQYRILKVKIEFMDHKMQFFSVKRFLADFSNEKVDMNRILTKIKVALIKEEII